MKNKTFVIIDAMAMAYKAYFAFYNRPLNTKKGEPTSAIFGFVNQLLKVLEDHKPDYIAVASDSKEKTFRHKMYKEYKATREEMPEDMVPQIGRIKEIVELMNIPLYIKSGYEADDIIGTVLRLAEKKGMISYAITPDKDYMQLVTEKSIVAKPGRGTDEVVFFNPEKVKENYGFEPKQMIDYLALVGDSSDNVPGVKGIGEKTALPLIQQFGTLENIYKNLNKIEKESVRKKLEENKDNAFLSKELVTINCNVPMEFDFEKAKFENPDFDKLRDLFIELELKNPYARLLKIYNHDSEQKEITKEELSTAKTFEKSKSNYELITTKKDAEKLADRLNKTSLFVFDTETDSLNPFELNIVGASFSTKAGEGFFVAIDPGSRIFSDGKERLPVDDFKKIFKSVFANKKIKKVCQNGKYDISVMRGLGIEVENFFFDTMVASYIIDPDQKHGMDDLSEKYLNYKPIPLSTLIGEKKDPTKIYDAEVEKLSDYAAEDADITFQLYEILSKIITKDKLEKVAFDVDFPLIPVLEAMEYEGVNIDKSALESYSKELQKLINGYTKKIYKSAGEEFNISSPKQLQVILFEKLGLESGRKTKTGFSTDARALENLRGEHEIIEMILNYRQASKLKSTYTDSLPNLINPKTGRVHTDFNQTVAATGRLSSLNPNLQNIPIRTEMGKEIRKAFVPRDKNYFLISADYSQIELRLLAAICKDEALMKAFKNGEDIHRSTAALVFMVDPIDVTPDMRRKAKEVNFGILYGIGPFGLKTRLGIPQAHAKEIIDLYFNTFKKVKNYMEDSVSKAKEKGFAETLLGRRRFLKNINSNNRVVRQFEERVAINMPIQGTAADMIKLAMIKIHNEFEKRKFKTKMVLQVHDELLFDAHKDEVDELRPLIKKIMESALPLDVPIVVDTGVGDNWLDAH
ncbi:MAG: DNA polymerase I [Ignavibacteriaceae bacterium]|nr:DNA polymerase I [Ignavibacteriaceae bacterium]